MAKENYTPEEKKTLKKMFCNSRLVFSSFNMVKMEGNAFALTMEPALDELYKDKKEKAGITETPQTLEDLLDVCKKLKDAGMTPISAGNYDMIMRYPAFKAFRLEGNDFIDNARMGKEK